MFKYSLLSLIIVAGLACPMADATISLDTVKKQVSGICTGAMSGLSSAKSAIAGEAAKCGTFIVDNKYPVAIGIVSAAVLSVFAYYAYKKYTDVQSANS